MKEEKITCDRCGQEIGEEYSNYPVNTRYWHCEPILSKRDGFVYAVYRTPDEPKDYCTDCFDKMTNEI